MLHVPLSKIVVNLASLRRRQRQAGEEIGVPVGNAFVVFQGVVVRGQEF